MEYEIWPLYLSELGTDIEKWREFVHKLGLCLGWTYATWPKGLIPIQEFYLNKNKTAYNTLLYCPNFIMGEKRDRHGISISGWFNVNVMYVARIEYTKPVNIVSYKSKEKFIEDYCKIVLDGKDDTVDVAILDMEILGEFSEKVTLTYDKL